MRNKKRRLAMMLQKQAEFAEHQAAMKQIAEESAKAAAAEKAKQEAAKAKAEAAAKAKAEAAAKAQAEAKAMVAAKKKEETIHSHDLAAPEASKSSTKKPKSRTKKASK